MKKYLGSISSTFAPNLAVGTFALALLVTATAHADVTIGGSRAQGMGGAGLALPVDITQNYVQNPAFLAYGSKGFKGAFPQIGARFRGFSISDLNDVIKSSNNGGVSSDTVLEIARRFGNEDKSAALNSSLAFSGGGFAIGGRGEVGINSVPNDALKSWDGQTSSLNGSERLDVYGYGYTSVDVAYGNVMRIPQGKLAVGATARIINGYFSHKFVDGNGIATGTGVQNGSNIPAGVDAEHEQGVAVDLGFLYNLPHVENLYFGLVVENAVKPNINFDVQNSGGSASFSDLKPFVTTYNAGVGFVGGKNLRLAADAIDIGNKAGRLETRYGAELLVAKGFSVRAGYNTRTAFTYGFEVFGLNVQIGGNAPITLASAIRF